MKKIFLIFFLLIPAIAFSQTWEDVNRLAITAHDNEDYQTAIKYYEQGLVLAKKEYGPKSIYYSVALDNYSQLCNTLGEYSKAEAMLLEALEIRKKKFGEYHEDYGNTLGRLAYSYEGLGEYEKSEQCYLKCIEIDSIIAGAQSEDYATDLANIGLLYKTAGKYELSERCLIHSLDIREQKGKENRDYVHSLNNLGLLYYELGKYDEAERMFLEVMEIDKKLIGENTSDFGIDLINLGGIYSVLGENQKAEEYYLRTKLIWEKTIGKETPQYFSLLNNLASTYSDLGDLDRSEQLYLECKAIGEKVYGTEHPQYAMCLNNLAGLNVQMGKLDEAEKLFIQAMTIRENALGNGHPEYATCMASLANLYYFQDRYAESEALYIKALRIMIQQYGQGHPEVGTLLLNVAMLYSTIGNYEKAEELYIASSNIIKESEGENSKAYVVSLFGLARMYRQLGKWDEAETYYQKSELAFRNIFGEDHMDYGVLLNGYAIVKQQTHDPKKAVELSNKSCEIFVNNMQRVFRFTSEEEKAKFLLTIDGYFDRAQTCYWTNHKIISTSSLDALNLHLATNGLILSSVAGLKERVISEGGDSVQNVYSNWEGYNNLITTELSKSVTARSPHLSSWQDESNQLEKQLNRISQTFKTSSVSLTPGYMDVKNSLKKDETAIEFISFNYVDDGVENDSIMYSAIVIRPEDSLPVYIPLFEQDQLVGLFKGDSIRTFANLLYTSAQIRDVENDISYGDSLYRLIWKPLDHLLKGKSHIYYSPAGLLHKINFDAVPQNTGTLLSDHYQMHRLTTTGKLVNRKDGSFNPASISLFGGIQYSMEENDLKKLANQNKDKTNDYSIAHIRGDSTSRGGFSYLPGSKTEVESINEIAKGKNVQTQLFIGATGSEEAVKNLNGANSPDILHFSTHGFFFPEVNENHKKMDDDFKRSVFVSSDNPLFRSGLILAGAEYVWKGNEPIAGVEDGILTAYEVSNLYLSNTRLVVMSACETGLGDIKGSEGVYGLQRAFKMAGVDYIIMTLWQVLDKETSEFMVSFYQNLLSKKSIPEAFKTTQDFMKNKYKDEPYKWAGFVLTK